VSEIDDDTAATRTELVDVFRDFETAVWAQINGQDTDDGRSEVAELVAAELARIQLNVATELEIVS
jgi:hypothetical protein